MAFDRGVLLFAACDPVYYERFGRAFIHSAVAHGNRVHVHLINPTAELRPVNAEGVTYSRELAAPEDRAWYAACRFLRALEIHRAQPQPHDRLLIMDIDGIVRSRLDPPSVPVGLFLRDVTGRPKRAQERSRVAAGLVLLGLGGMLFFEALAQRLERTELAWYSDQLALAQTMDAFAGRIPIHDFGQDPRWMDWDFRPDSVVWTAKGPRKDENPTYLAELARWTDPVGA